MLRTFCCGCGRREELDKCPLCFGNTTEYHKELQGQSLGQDPQGEKKTPRGVEKGPRANEGLSGQVMLSWD